MIEAEPLPDGFSSSNLRRSLVILGALALVVPALTASAGRTCACSSSPAMAS